MSSTLEGLDSRHPVRRLLAAVDAGASDVAEAALWSLSDAELGDLVVAAARAKAQLDAVALRLVAEADGRGLAGRVGAPSTQAWLRHRLRCTPQQAAGQVRLARRLRRLPAVSTALDEGRVGIAHARVIAEAIDELPERSEPPKHPELAESPEPSERLEAPDQPDAESTDTLRARAEAHLVAQCERFDPYQVARLGRRVLEVVDPDAADAAEAAKLAESERRAWLRRDLSFTPDGHGGVHVRGRLDTESAAVIRRALDPLAKPRPSGPDLPDLRTAGARLADAWVELTRRQLVAGDLPTQKGERPQIVVTIDHAALRDATGAGRLDTGEDLSPGAVRRLACDAGILPAVLGSDSAVLDLGRAERLFTPAQRRALILRDRGCAFPGCDRPPAWTEAHHVEHWIDGGATDVGNAVLLCGYHHREIHKRHWTVRITDDGQPEFTPPRYVDPTQTPIRQRQPVPT